MRNKFIEIQIFKLRNQVQQSEFFHLRQNINTKKEAFKGNQKFVNKENLMSFQIAPSTKNLTQLPVIMKKPVKISSPLIDRMRSLHAINLKTIKQQQYQNDSTIQKYFVNKSHYFATIHKKKQQNIAKVLKSLQNKSTELEKSNTQKQKRHNQLFRSLVALSKQKIKANYLKQKTKMEMAHTRKQQFDLSRSKHVFIKKPNYRKLYLEQLNQSQQLHKMTVQKLLNAQNRRTQLKREKQNATKGKLDCSIMYAQTYVSKVDSERQQRFIEKSLGKIKQSEKLMKEQKERSRSNSETSRKSMNQKIMKARSMRTIHEKQMIEKLQKILQEKQKKTQNIKERKAKNLEQLSNSLRKSRSQHFEEAQKKSRSLFIESQMKSQNILQENHEKWKFLTGIKLQFEKVKNKNLYESQKVTLRC